jgi:hypothetical protein
MQSGIMFLPLILSQLIVSVVGGIVIQRARYYLPEVVLGNMVIAIRAGLSATLSVTSNPEMWIGYQLQIGEGRGLVLQIADLILVNLYYKEC